MNWFLLVLTGAEKGDADDKEKSYLSCLSFMLDAPDNSGGICV